MEEMEDKEEVETEKVIACVSHLTTKILLRSSNARVYTGSEGRRGEYWEDRGG